jgi:hypothetical protein
MSTPKTSNSIDGRLNQIVPDAATPSIDSATEQAICDRLIDSLEPVRPIPSRTVLVAIFLTIFGIVTAVLVGFFGTGGATEMTLPQLGGILTAIVVSAGLASVSLSREMSPGQSRIFHPGTMTVGVLLALLALVIGLFPWSEGPMVGWHCFRSGFLFSLPSVALVLAVIRRGSPLAWGAVGATAGLLGGLVGMAAIHVGCSMLNAPHMATGHLTIPLAGAVGGYLAGKALPYLLPS